MKNGSIHLFKNLLWTVKESTDDGSGVKCRIIFTDKHGVSLHLIDVVPTRSDALISFGFRK